MKTSPLVVLGLDAADVGYIQRWVQEGYLPTIASVMQRGCWGRIGGPELISTHGTWLSLFSGVSRSEHGFYYSRQLKPGSYDFQRVIAQEAHALPFWSHLRKESEKVAIIDAPEAYPLGGLHGIQLANWATPPQYNTAAPPVAAEPLSLLQDVHRLIGRQIRIDVFKPNGSFHEDLQTHRLLLKRVEQKGTLCRHFLRGDPYDLVVIAFSEAHTASHRFWNYRPERLRPTDSPNKEHELLNAIRDVYQAIDRELGLLLERLPDAANIFIVSLFGMKDLYPTNGLIEAFCRQLGYQCSADGASRKLDPLATVRRIISPQRRAQISRLLPLRIQERLQADQFRTATNWAETRAFSIPSLNTSLLRVNLRGREPQGIVEPGHEYERLLNQIEADLRLLVDPRTGKPAVEKIARSVDAFGGRIPLILPDLFIEWNASAHFMERVTHPKAELVQTKPWYNRSSYHSFNGFVAAAGPSIGGRGAIGEVTLLDLAPTFLSLMGESIPRGMTGQVITAITHRTKGMNATVL